MIKKVLVVSFFLYLSSASLAREDSHWKGDGNSLLHSCSLMVKVLDGEHISSGENIDASFCNGYILGVGDMDSFLRAFEQERKVNSGIVHLCVPSGVTTGQVVRVVAKWLKNNPEKLEMPASALVLAALREAFPCK